MRFTYGGRDKNLVADNVAVLSVGKAGWFLQVALVHRFDSDNRGFDSLYPHPNLSVGYLFRTDSSVGRAPDF